MVTSVESVANKFYLLYARLNMHTEIYAFNTHKKAYQSMLGIKHVHGAALAPTDARPLAK